MSGTAIMWSLWVLCNIMGWLYWLFSHAPSDVAWFIVLAVCAFFVAVVIGVKLMFGVGKVISKILGI